LSTLSSIALPKPRDWQDFERKMRELIARVLADPNTQMNGRSGQPQNGVDIWGHRNEDRSRLVGVQCKKSDNEVTVAELDAELEKAKGFTPTISEFILVTTASRDAKIQKRARELTESLAKTDRPIFVAAWGWEDIEERAADYAEVRDAFDPTFNPYAKRSHQETVARLDDIAGQLKPAKLATRAAPFILPQHETASFTGREDELKALERALFDDRVSGVCTIAGLSGTGGIGKSALAVHFATVHRDRFSDGVIGLRVDGKDNDAIAREFARNAGEVIEPDDDRESAAIMQSAFGGREILLIFDNAEAAGLRSLVPGGRSSVIITTRHRSLPVALEVPEAARVEVPALAEEGGVELLRKRLGNRVEIDVDAAKRVVALVGGLPLALQIVASLLEMEPWRELAAFADILNVERQRLSALAVRDDPDLDIRVSFNASLKFLKTEEVDFFACLSVCDPDSFALRSAAATTGCDEVVASQRLGYLYRLSLVNRTVDISRTRFVLHPLLRLFARELANQSSVFHVASDRHASYFIKIVRQFGTHYVPASLSIAEDIGDTLAAARWLLGRQQLELDYLMCLAPLLERFGFWQEASEILAQFLTLAEAEENMTAVLLIKIQQAKFLQLRGDFQASLAVLQPVAGTLDLLSGELRAIFHNTYAGVLQRLGRLQDAADALAKAEVIEAGLGNEHGLAMVLNSLGGVLQRSGRLQEAIEVFSKAEKIEVSLGKHRGQAMVLNSIGGALQRLGRFDEAAVNLQRSLELLIELGDQRGQAMVLTSMSVVLQNLGRVQEAADALKKAGDIEEQLKNVRGQAMVLHRLGGLLQRLGRFQEAVGALRAAEDIENQLGNIRGQAMVLNTLGTVLEDMGLVNDAEAALLKSRLLGEQIGDSRQVSIALTSLGAMWQRLGRLEDAADVLERAREILETSDDERSLAKVLNNLGGVRLRLNRLPEAVIAFERSKIISEKSNDERSLAAVLGSLGSALQRLGKFQEAADALERAKTIREQMGDERNLARVLSSLGGVLQRLGKFHEAAGSLERSYDLLAAQGDERGQAMVLNSLGVALQRAGKIEDADRAFTSSIRLGDKLNDKTHLAKVRTAYGKALVSRGDESAGIEQLRQGFLLDENAGNKRGLSIITPLLVNILRSQRQNEEAEDFLLRALAIAPSESAIQRLTTPERGLSTSAVRMTGHIKRLLEPMGRPRFGFFKTDTDGPDVYFSERQIGSDVFSSLSVGMIVEGDVILDTNDRREAIAIRRN
jgi:tetratricopeptide (TPR) repeat protein